MKSIYQETKREKSVRLVQEANPVFYGGLAGKLFMSSIRDFVLIDGMNNIYEPIRNEVVDYFKTNGISWWGGNKPTGHILSSQIACINHLYGLRYDKSAVLDILKSISVDFVDVLSIDTDKTFCGYIQFESVSDNDYINEGQPTRGNNCTSIDALIYAKHCDGSRWLIPIEWKFTEHYNNQDKSKEGFSKDPLNCKGEVRKKRYSNLISNSSQLKNPINSCYYFEPFYQLMRQTLWAEQMIANNSRETIKADNYLHVHVIPKENTDLLEKKYRCSGLDMESTWRLHLKDQSKYVIISPEQLISNIDKDKYKNLIDYLSIRY